MILSFRALEKSNVILVLHFVAPKRECDLSFACCTVTTDCNYWQFITINITQNKSHG